MKYVKEIVIIFGITMVGELLNKFIPLPVPAGVYGLFILLAVCAAESLSSLTWKLRKPASGFDAGDVYPGGCGNY